MSDLYFILYERQISDLRLLSAAIRLLIDSAQSSNNSEIRARIFFWHTVHAIFLWYLQREYAHFIWKGGFILYFSHWSTPLCCVSEKIYWLKGSFSNKKLRSRLLYVHTQFQLGTNKQETQTDNQPDLLKEQQDSSMTICSQPCPPSYFYSLIYKRK